MNNWIVPTMLMLIPLGIVITAAVRIAMRGKDIYKIRLDQWARVQAGSHLLTFEAEGWTLVPLAEATEQVIEEHVYHMSFADKAAIETNMQHGGQDDPAENAERAEQVMLRTLALFQGQPLPGEDDGAEDAYTRLRDEYRGFPGVDQKNFGNTHKHGPYMELP